MLANEFLCCHLAEHLNLPVNRARLISIDERLLRAPRQAGLMPADFSAGIRCGMIRFEQYQPCQSADIMAHCANATDLHGIVLFEQFVCRGDGRQLLMYPDPTAAAGSKFFAAYDYGYAFGGQPLWSAASIAVLPAPTLPLSNPFDASEYSDGTALANSVEGLRGLSLDGLKEILMRLCPPRWGVPPEEVDALIPALVSRATSLVAQFDAKFRPQMEIR